MKNSLDDRTRKVIHHLMTARGLTHAQVALGSGICKTSVTRVLTGERQVTVDKLQGFARALKMPAHRIVAEAERWDSAGLPMHLR